MQLERVEQGDERDGGDPQAGGVGQFGYWEWLLVGAVATLLLVAPHATAQTEGASEYQVKAAYLYNFAKSTEWPEQRLPRGTPLLLGIVGGDDEFIDTVSNSVSGKTAGTHSIVVKRVESDADISFCHLVFFRSSAGHKRTESAIFAQANSSILWVGEDSAFLREGGMINLFFKRARVRFEINRASMERVGIRLSAALLALANPEPGGSNNLAAEPGATVPVASGGGESRRLQVSSPPEYPEIAKKMGIKGAVQVEASIRRDGTVKDVRIIGGHPMLADALAKAVMGWQYEPAAKESQVMVRFIFNQ